MGSKKVLNPPTKKCRRVKKTKTYGFPSLSNMSLFERTEGDSVDLGEAEFSLLSGFIPFMTMIFDEKRHEKGSCKNMCEYFLDQV